MEISGNAILASMAARLRPAGMIPRGGFRPDAADGVPPLADGAAPGAVVLVGNAGRDMWRAFAAAGVTGDDPLDRWTRGILNDVATTLGAVTCYPFDGPPWLPFQRWARRVEPVHASPIGPLIHPEFGLWHAYRGALMFAGALDLPVPRRRPSPCDTCADKPCLSTCPVAALKPGTYDTAACAAHINTAAGAGCLDAACRARAACPVGRDYRYGPEQARFHMAAFLRRLPMDTKDDRNSV